MIRGEKQRVPLWILHRYVRWRLRRMFHAIYLSGPLEELDKERNYPILFFANHQSWWDGFLMQPFFDAFKMEYYIMMEERNLRRFSFFRRVGVFGVDLESAAGRAASLLYAGRLLRDCPSGRRRALLVYPHGRLVDPVEPWPAFQPGLEKLCSLNRDGATFPLYLHLRMGRYPLPEVFMQLGKPVDLRKNPTRETLEDRLTEARDALRVQLIETPEKAQTLALLPAKRRFRGQTQ